VRRSTEAEYLDKIKNEIKRIVQRCFELFNQYDVPMQAFRNLQIDEGGDQWQMQSGIGPDWSTLEFQFNIFSSHAATFEPLVNSILNDPELVPKLPFDPNAIDARPRYYHFARGWMWHTFIKPCLDAGFTHDDKFQFNEQVFDTLFNQFMREIESPVVAYATYLMPLVHLKLSAEDANFTTGLKLRRIGTKEIERWLNPDRSLSHLELRPEDVGWIRCGVEAKYDVPGDVEHLLSKELPASILGNQGLTPLERALRWASVDASENLERVLRTLRLVTDGHIYEAFILSEVKALLWHSSTLTQRSKLSPMLSMNKTLGAEESRQALNLWGLLKDGPNAGYLDLGFRRWSGAADRFTVPSRSAYEDMLVDYWIGLESLFSPDSNQEVKFRASLRIAAFLGETPEERQELYDEMRLSYDWRSAIVHGDKKQMKNLGKKKELYKVAAKTRSNLRAAILKIAESNQPFNPKDTETRLLGYRE
jgi:hypothetical protein